jgi:hypothetical protein
MRQDCREPMCRAHTLTTNEFMRLGGENWPQSFRATLGKRSYT